MSANTITANARIDGREELIAKLHGKLTLKSSPSDAELILNAYEAWGEDCVKHLIGDFAFAIWDNRLQRFFCARDRSLFTGPFVPRTFMRIPRAKTCARRARAHPARAPRRSRSRSS